MGVSSTEADDGNDDRYPRSTTAGVVDPRRGDGPRRMRNHRITYALGTLALAAIVVSAVTDVLGWTTVTRVSSATASATGGGYVLTVRYPEVTRPALASPFEIEVERDGGFDGPVQVAVSQSWLRMWDENAWHPEPSTGVGEGDEVVLEFDPPEGEVLRVVYDARIEPDQQRGRDGHVAVVQDGAHVVRVDFHTRVLP